MGSRFISKWTAASMQIPQGSRLKMVRTFSSPAPRSLARKIIPRRSKSFGASNYLPGNVHSYTLGNVLNAPLGQSILTQHHGRFRYRHGATAFQFRLGHHLIALSHPDNFFDRGLSLGHATPAIGA